MTLWIISSMNYMHIVSEITAKISILFCKHFDLVLHIQVDLGLWVLFSMNMFQRQLSCLC